MRTSDIALCLLVALLGVSAQGSEMDVKWEEYKMKFKKTYDPDEDAWRRSIWEETVERVAKHNRDAEDNLYTYTLGINAFSDMTNEEFTAGYTGLLEMDDSLEMNIGINYTVFLPTEENIPDYVNWVEKGVITDVKYQGNCGSCWIFAAVGAIESQHALKTGELVSLSEQNILDCNTADYGCNGGHEWYAFDYVKENDGIETEASYAYEAEKGECRYNPEYRGATISAIGKVLPQGDELAMKHAVATVGALAVGVSVGNFPEFQSYKSGILSSKECMDKHTDHGVVIVGYGTEDGVDYWLIKNSWGKWWGVDGYFYLQRNKNMCGIAYEAHYAII